MRLSAVFGILSLLMLIFAILSVVLPTCSVLYGVHISTNGNTNGRIPTSVTIANSGFLPVNDISMVVIMSAPNGTTLSAISMGPMDIPAGASVPLGISQSETNFNATSGLSFVTIRATASVDLGGLIPISLNADFMIEPGNGTIPGGSL